VIGDLEVELTIVGGETVFEQGGEQSEATD